MSAFKKYRQHRHHRLQTEVQAAAMFIHTFRICPHSWPNTVHIKIWNFAPIRLFCFVQNRLSPQQFHGFGALTPPTLWQFSLSPWWWNCANHTFKSHARSTNSSLTKEILGTPNEGSSTTVYRHTGMIDLVTWSDSLWGSRTLARHHLSSSCHVTPAFQYKIICIECLE